MTSTPVVRYPRLQVLADGEVLEGAVEARITSNNYYTPDRFSLRIQEGSKLNGLRDCLTLHEGTTFRVLVSLDAGANFACLSVGQGDILSCDHMSRGIRIDGRDLSASLQDSPANDVFSNRTSSEIATILAARHGLLPVVMPTMTLAGRYYHEDTSQMAHNQFSRTSTEWDLLVYLARCENCDVFVIGSALYFQPVGAIEGSPVSLMPADLISLRLRRRLRLSGDIIVTVKSWNSKQGIAIIRTVLSQRLSPSSSSGSYGALSPQYYHLVQPNISASDAERLGRNRADELARHEQCVEITMPGELNLAARSKFYLQGTDSDFDQLYQVDSIERTIGPFSGFVQRISAHSISIRQTILMSAGV